VPTDIPWARIALEQSADAINFWLGNERSVTAMHRDNYENVYVQVVGRKHFVLLPPIEQPCVNELELAQYRYAPSTNPVSKSNLNQTRTLYQWQCGIPNHQSTTERHTRNSRGLCA
jgi:jumonji domain-containing protein 7